MACNSRKRLFDSMSQENVKRCKFDDDVMDLQHDDNTQEMQEDKQEVETNPSVSQYIPKRFLCWLHSACARHPFCVQ